MVHHNTKFGDKMLGGLEDIIWINTHWHFEYNLNLCCDLDHHSSSVNKFHKTLWLMIMYQHRASLVAKDQKNQQFRRYSGQKLQLMMLHHHTKFSSKMFCSSKEHSLAFWMFTLTLNAVIQFMFTEHSSLWCCTSKPGLVAKGPAV